jgi:catechol-2,3-dioxygenase
LQKKMSFRHVTKSFMSTGAKLRNIILLVKDIDVSAHFYQSAIGVAVLGKGENIIQLDSGGTSIILKVC